MKISRREALKASAAALLAGPAVLSAPEKSLYDGWTVELPKDTTPPGPWSYNPVACCYEMKSPKGQVERCLKVIPYYEAVEKRLWLVNGHLVRARLCAKTG